ncbi:hypothetical protein XENOCAPTIV_009683 [Xenoophorus captivus]|uniref:Uncharacterized protein n=1 Tax=Xenoophorus captivus TaxID=1517983 RepID=A0ABV0S625_9TELE
MLIYGVFSYNRSKPVVVTADQLSQVGVEVLHMTLWADRPSATAPGGGGTGIWIGTTKPDTHLLSPLTQTSFPVARSTEVIRQMNGNAIIHTHGGSHPGSAIKSYQHPPVSCTYPHVTYDEDEIDEGLGGPASQEHPDDQDSEASSSNFSKNRISPQCHNPHTSYVHKAQIV